MRPGSKLPTRRSLLALAAGIGATACGPEPKAKQTEKPPLRILVRAAWRAGDMGELASTSGLLSLIALNLPRAEITLWPKALDPEARDFLARNHDRVRIASADAEIESAFASADFFLHGSGPAVASADVEAWRKRGNKRYGFLGISVEEAAVSGLRSLFEGAAFVYTGERASLENLKNAGLAPAKIGFAPDAAFSFRLTAEPEAKAFLAANGLEQKKFIVVAPHGGANLRDGIASWVRTSGNKVLLAAETAADLRILEPLRASLPADVRNRVVRSKTVWLPSEASSVLRRAVAVVGERYYAPVLAAINDTPCLSIGGGIEARIWDDLGLKRWHFEPGAVAGIADALKSISEHYAGVQVDVHEAVIAARRLQTGAVERVNA